jgi:hypothetical protein
MPLPFLLLALSCSSNAFASSGATEALANIVEVYFLVLMIGSLVIGISIAYCRAPAPLKGHPAEQVPISKVSAPPNQEISCVKDQETDAGTNRNRNIIRRLWLIAGSVVVLAYWSLNLNGFCFSQWRFPSNDEKMRMAVAEVNTYGIQGYRGLVGVSDEKGNQYFEQPIPYGSFEEFNMKNPDCCVMFSVVPGQGTRGGDGDPVPSFLDQMTGAYNFSVRFSFIQRDQLTPDNRHANENVSHIKETHVQNAVRHFSCCGTRWE